MSKNLIIAIDGPAASGKSTLAKELTNTLNFVYLDTGAMYRAITFLALDKNIADDISAVIELTRQLKIELRYETNVTRVFVNDIEVTDKIRSTEVNAKVSDISRIAEVRKEMVKIQRKLGENSSLVAEGRDITTVVFPNAEIKIFLTASLEERTNRRYKEFREKGMEITLEDVKENLINRDRIDSGREVSPLKKANDAVELDTTDMTVGEEVDFVLDLIKELEKVETKAGLQ